MLSTVTVQKEENAVAAEKVDEKQSVEQVGNAIVVKSSAISRVVAAKTIAAVKQTEKTTVGGVGAVGRSQIPKPTAAVIKSSNDSAPTKVADSTRISPTKSVSISSSSSVRSRSTMAVVGRAKTVELGSKSMPAKKMSVGELQAPKVIRQMSAGQMQPQSPSRVLPVKSHPRLKSAETSPIKKTSLIGSNKTEEMKKATTTTGNNSFSFALKNL